MSALCFWPPSSRGQLERSWTCCTSGCTSVRGMTCSGSWASLGPRSHFPNFHRAIGRLKGFVPGPGASAGHRRDRRQQWAAGGGWKAESPASWLAIRRIFNSVFNWKVFKAKLPTPQDVVWPRLWVFNGGCKRPDTGDCFAGNPPACDFSYCEQLKSSQSLRTATEGTAGVRVTEGARLTSRLRQRRFFHMIVWRKLTVMKL